MFSLDMILVSVFSVLRFVQVQVSMAALTETSPTTFRTSLTYLNDEPKYGTEKPYRLLHPVEATPEVPESNMEFTTHGDILIKDLRGINNDLSLEKNAFKLYNWPSAINPSATYEEIEAYCRAMANLLKYELNAQKTWVFDFRVSYTYAEYIALCLNG